MSKRNKKPYFELTKVIIKYKKNALSGLSGFSIFHVDLTSWMITFEKSAQIIFVEKVKICVISETSSALRW